MPQKESLVSVLILNHNGLKLLAECLPSVLSTNYSNFEIVLVDNGSTDGSVDYVRESFGDSSRIKIIRLSSNIGVTKAFNIGLKAAGGDLIASLNNDTIVDRNWLDALVCELDSHPHAGAAQCKLLAYFDRSLIDSAGCQMDPCGHAIEKGYRERDQGQYYSGEEIFSAGLPASIYRRDVLDRVGSLDTDFFAGYEDADLCWRIRLNGYTVIYAPEAIVYHRRNSTSRSVSELTNFVSWNFSKNWIAMLLKNYSLSSLLRISHRIIVGAFLSSFGYLLLAKKELRFIGLSAIVWNIRHFKEIMVKRSIIQSRIRQISDDDIRRVMRSGCVLLQNYRNYRNQLRAV